MNIRYIVGTPTHLEYFIPLIRAYYAYDGHGFDEGHVRRTLADFLNHPDYGRAYLIADSDAWVGYFILTFGYSLEFGGRDAFIDEIYLTESHRGQGVGRQTIAFILEQARAIGIKAVHLEVMPQNTRAHRFYLQVGFENRGQLMSQYVEARGA
ncbi:MAG: GNAT family N-acetyltransferase [Anaerolineae bacterium]|nr:GNAT family N-acetyltransferase [Anaerolineae bacterium]